LSGSGNDAFVFETGFQDVINDFAAGSGIGDVIRFDDMIFADYAAVIAASVQVGNTTVITASLGNSVTLKNVNLANLNVDDFAFV
jgi:hypothetical protein